MLSKNNRTTFLNKATSQKFIFRTVAALALIVMVEWISISLLTIDNAYSFHLAESRAAQDSKFVSAPTEFIALTKPSEQDITEKTTLVSQVFVTPPKNKEEAVEVTTGIYIEEILNIDEGMNVFEAKGYLDLTWKDPRLKFNPATEKVDVKIYLEHDADLLLEKIWWPDVEFSNKVNTRATISREIQVAADGIVDYRERFRGTFATNFEMQDFPFDTQELMLKMESFAWNSEELVFRQNDSLISFSEEFILPGWRIDDIEERNC